MSDIENIQHRHADAARYSTRPVAAPLRSPTPSEVEAAIERIVTRGPADSLAEFEKNVSRTLQEAGLAVTYAALAAIRARHATS